MATIRHWLEYSALRTIIALFGPYPPEQTLRTARAIATLYAKRSKGRIERARLNIERSFPDLPHAETERIAVESVRHIIELFMVDATAMPDVVHEWSWPRYAAFCDFEKGLDLVMGQGPCILLTGHVGNWEYLGYQLALIGFRMTALARPLNNPLLYRWLLNARQASGLRILDKWGATQELQRIVSAGGKIAFIADQNAGDDGMFVPFFGKLASSYKSIGLLAMRYQLPVIAGFARRLGEHFRYELSVPDVIWPHEWEAMPDPLFYITARFNLAIENMIRAAPEQYLWIHRRWKSRPKHEREGQPMPAKLRAKLEALPWMTPELIESCAAPM